MKIKYVSFHIAPDGSPSGTVNIETNGVNLTISMPEDIAIATKTLMIQTVERVRLAVQEAVK